MKHSRLWLISLIAALVIVLLSVTVAAETAIIDSGTCGDSLTWALYEDGVLEITGEGEMEDYDGTGTAPWYSYRDLITSVVIGENVTSIGDYAFSRCSSLSGELYIPGNVLSIGEGAFFECTGFTALTLSDGVTRLGESAFDGCSVMEGSLVLPDSVKTMRDLTFYRCTGFDSLILPNELTHIPDGAFSGCTGLTSVVFGEKTSIIGEFAFVDCTSLTELEFPEGLNYIYLEAFRGCTGLEKVSFPSTLQRIDGRAFSGCSNLRTAFFIGDAPTGDETVFYGCHKDLILYWMNGTSGWGESKWGIPTRSITGMGQCGDNLTWMLYDDGLLEVSGTGEMKNYAKTDAPWLTYSSQLKSLRLNDGITVIGEDAFNGCSGFTGELYIPDGVTLIDDGAFHGCNGFTSLRLPEGVVIAEESFSGCSGISGILEIPQNVSVGIHAFTYCYGIEKLILPSGMKSVGQGAFMQCSGLQEIVFPDTFEELKRYTFSFCSSLTGEIRFPASLNSIGESAVHGCSELSRIVFEGDAPTIEGHPFVNCSDDLTLYYFDNATGWDYPTWNGYKTKPVHTKPTITGHTLVLSGQIGVNFYVDLSMLTEEEREAVTMTFTVNGKTTTDTFDASCTNPNTGEYYGFTCYINSVQMADEITAVLNYGDDQKLSSTYSAAQYVQTFLANEDAYSPNAAALVKAIADFGHYVQPFLAASTGWTLGEDHALMSGCTEYSAVDVEEARQATSNYSVDRDVGDSQVEAITFSLNLETETAICIYLKMKDGYTGSVTATLGGNPIDCKKQNDGRYRIEISGIPAHKLGDKYSVVISAGGTASISVSALSYVDTALNSDLEIVNNDAARYAVTSLYRYYAAAMKYKENPNG